MDQIAHLPAEGGTLLILPAVDGADWHQVVLETDRQIELGANTLGYIIGHLLDSLINPRPTGMNREECSEADEQVQWILTLAEKYTSIYTVLGSNPLALRILDKNAVWIARITLTDEQRADWVRQLKALKPHQE